MTNDQHLLQAVAKIYPDLVSELPDAWDIHFASGAWKWTTEKVMLENRPRAGFVLVHLNGGGSSKLSAFEHSATYKQAWLFLQYYATFPWLWTRFHLESQLKDGQKGYRVAVEQAIPPKETNSV